MSLPFHPPFPVAPGRSSQGVSAHRLWLGRSLVPPIFRQQPIHPLLWVMLNPSEATQWKDDPTMVRVVNFTQLFGFDSLFVVNLFTFRSSDPAMVKPLDPFSNDKRADEVIRWLAPRCEAVICAWGSGAAINGVAQHAAFVQRACSVVDILAEPGGPPMYTLGRTPKGFPRHPLYLPRDTRREGFYA